MDRFGDEPNERQCLMPTYMYSTHAEKEKRTHREPNKCTKNEKTIESEKGEKERCAENWINCNGNCVLCVLKRKMKLLNFLAYHQ